jgi:glycerol-3-phosphate dehydrogenase
MRRRLRDLEEQEFDLLVIGAGIFGAAAAWEATRRGLSVAVIDRGDFCGATSAHSYKLIHGGLRYLQHGDLHRLRQSANARRTFLRIAPHLARPLPIVVPTYGYGKKGKPLLRLATAIYDAATLDRNRGIVDPARRVPRSRALSRREVLDAYPGLPSHWLTGAVMFYDGQMYNPPRLVLAFLRSAVDAGAVAANYVAALRFLGPGDGAGPGERVSGVVARDQLGGGSLRIRAKMVLNAAGPYAEGLLERALGRPLEPPTPWSRDAYLVVRRALLPDERALALPAASRDPEAILSRGERHLFLVPWHGHTLVGVWHQVYSGAPDAYHVTEAELEAFIGEINAACPALALRLDDVAQCIAGLIPFGDDRADARNLRFAHRSRLVDHARERGLEGLVTLIGVRYTTGPCEAADAVDLICRKLGRDPAPSRSDANRLDGGEIDDLEALIAAAQRQHRTLPAEVVRALVHNHGAAYPRVLADLADRPELGETLGSSPVIAAEVVHAVREEMAITMADVAFRRTDLATGGDPGETALGRCAAIMARECGWDQARMREEQDSVRASLSGARRPERDVAAARAPA